MGSGARRKRRRNTGRNKQIPNQTEDEVQRFLNEASTQTKGIATLQIYAIKPSAIWMVIRKDNRD